MIYIYRPHISEDWSSSNKLGPKTIKTLFIRLSAYTDVTKETRQIIFVIYRWTQYMIYVLICNVITIIMSGSVAQLFAHFSVSTSTHVYQACQKWVAKSNQTKWSKAAWQTTTGSRLSEKIDCQLLVALILRRFYYKFQQLKLTSQFMYVHGSAGTVLFLFVWCNR